MSMTSVNVGLGRRLRNNDLQPSYLLTFRLSIIKLPNTLTQLSNGRRCSLSEAIDCKQ